MIHTLFIILLYIQYIKFLKIYVYFNFKNNLKFQSVCTSLDIIHTAVYYAANRKIKDSETLNLIDTAIYCATVDKQNEILLDILNWHCENLDLVGANGKLNADCMIHASLEDDKERLKILYSYGYRHTALKFEKIV